MFLEFLVSVFLEFLVCEDSGFGHHPHILFNVASGPSAHLCFCSLCQSCLQCIFLTEVLELSFLKSSKTSLGMCFFPFPGEGSSLHPLVLLTAGATLEFAAEGHAQVEMCYQSVHLI